MSNIVVNITFGGYIRHGNIKSFSSDFINVNFYYKDIGGFIGTISEGRIDSRY